MSINYFGKKVREARKNTNPTLMTMATAMGTTPGFLSAIETGRSKIPTDWVEKIYDFFKETKSPLDLDELRNAADVSNESVSLSGLPLQHQFLIAGFANSELNAEQLDNFKTLLQDIYRNTKVE